MDAWSNAPELENASSRQPLYCLRCGREGPAGGHVCPDCGDALAERGYCPVCEDDWSLPLGATCPKHEIELIARPPELRPSAGDRGPRWVTIATYADSAEAEATRLRLEAEGIPTFVDGERMARNAIYSVATGGAKLQVPEPLVTDARVLLAQSWSPVEHEDDLDDAWDELAPEPGAKRRAVMKGVILFMLLSPLILTILAWLLR